METVAPAGCDGRLIGSAGDARAFVAQEDWTTVDDVWNNRCVPVQLDSALAKALLSGAAGVDVDRAAVEAAVNQQLIHGGTLDTLLLEAGVIDEPTVARALSLAWQTTPVSTTAIEDPDQRAVSLLPARMAVAMGLVPFALADDGTLHVACRAPLDTGLIAEVGALIRATVVAHVVPEVRLCQGLAAAYDHELDERFVALLRQLAPTSKAVQHAANDVDTTTTRVSEDPIVTWDLVEAMAHLAAQDSRDGIARVAVAFARKFLPFAAVFGVRDNATVGWHRSGPSEGVQFTARPFPIPDDGFLAQALSSPSPVLLKPELVAGNAAVFGWLGRRRPKTVLVVPIVVARRPVGALYADGGIRQRDPRDVGELVGFGARLGPAFESLLRQRHRAHPSLFPQPALSLPPMAIEPVMLLPGPPPMPGQSSVPPMPSWLSSSSPSLPAPPPMPTSPSSGLSMPSMSASIPTMSSSTAAPPGSEPPRDGTSPFARGYITSVPLPAPPPMPTSPPSTPPSMPMTSSLPRTSSSSLASLSIDGPRDAFVLTGMGAPLNEHLLQQMRVPPPSAPQQQQQPSSALFNMGDENAPAAWRGALTDTVEKGLQGGSGAAVVDDDDLNWEAVVYDPAHAAELEPGSADKGDRGLDFPSLSSATLADLYGDSDDNSEISIPPPPLPSSAATFPPIEAIDSTSTAPVPSSSSPSPSPSSSSSATRDPPLATMSHKDLVELLFAGDDDLVARAGRELVGRGLAAVAALGERFPGRLRVDPFDPGENIRTTAPLGPLVDVLGRLGNDGLDAAVGHVDSRYPAHRFAAVLLFAQTPDTRAMDLLRNRLHDAEPRIQKLAAEALVPFLAHPRFESLLLHLRERAGASTRPYPVEARRRAAELLGEFRDVGAVPLLMGLLGYSEMQDTARQALRAITLQDFGARPKAWEKWWARAKKRSRLDWLLEALSSEELGLRSSAHRELADLAGDDFGYRADADKRARQRAVEVWQQWWAEEQRRAPQPKAATRM